MRPIQREQMYKNRPERSETGVEVLKMRSGLQNVTRRAQICAIL